MNDAEQCCDDCNKNEYPVYEVSYAHPDIQIRNVATNKKRTIPGKPILRRVCSQCVHIYEKVTVQKEGIFNAKIP